MATKKSSPTSVTDSMSRLPPIRGATAPTRAPDSPPPRPLEPTRGQNASPARGLSGREHQRGSNRVAAAGGISRPARARIALLPGSCGRTPLARTGRCSADLTGPDAGRAGSDPKSPAPGDPAGLRAAQADSRVAPHFVALPRANHPENRRCSDARRAAPRSPATGASVVAPSIFRRHLTGFPRGHTLPVLAGNSIHTKEHQT